MRHFFTFLLVIILNALVFGQNITFDLNLTKKDSLYFFQDKKYSGEVISLYPNGQAKQKFETINGLAASVCYNYYEDPSFDKSKFLDTSVIRSLNQKIKKKRKQILDKKKDTLNKQNEINKYIDDDIGGFKKLEKLKEKSTENDLNKRKQKQWDSLTVLSNQKKILIEDLNKLLSQEQNFVDLKKKEESKPVYQNKVELEFEHRNFVKNGKLKRYYKNGFPKEFSNFKQNAYSGGNCATHSGDIVPPIPEVIVPLIPEVIVPLFMMLTSLKNMSDGRTKNKHHGIKAIDTFKKRRE